jgi:hypothetical protein
LLIPFLVLLFGCPELDPEDPDEQGLSERRELEIWWNNPDGDDVELRVLDIDPGEDGKALIYLQDRGNVTMGDASTDSGSVFVKKEDVEFAITGLPGGMGIITFTNRAGTKEAKLRVFVRNWNWNKEPAKSNVFRHTLEPDPVNYPFVEERPDGQGYVGNSSYKNTSWAIYKLILDRGFFYEAPDGVSGQGGVHADKSLENWNRGVHNHPHILYHPKISDPLEPLGYRYGKDPVLGKTVFAFVMHYDFDGDMVGGFPDRQRLELKTMNKTTPPAPYNQGSGDRMFSEGNGDTFTHRWKFKLPKDFKVSTEYTHIHQIKPEGADNGNPTFTVTARKKSNNEEVLQLIYRGPIREIIGDREIPSVNWYPAEVPLDPFRGEWIRAEEMVTYDNPGAYRIKLVRIRDMKVLMEYEYSPETYDEEDPFVMFRKGNTYIRAKYGVYRRIMHMTPFGLPNKDDPVLEYKREGDEVRVLYTDIEMDKWKY